LSRDEMTRDEKSPNSLGSAYKFKWLPCEGR